MISVLLYSRENSAMTQVIASQLEQLGYSPEQSQIINIPRLILNSYDIVHIIVDSLPLTLNEFFCISTAKTLGKAVVLSVLDSQADDSFSFSSTLTNSVEPDALTVSQTNYLKVYREKESHKMILPKLFDFENVKPKNNSSEPIEGFIFPLIKKLDEASLLKSDKPVYFDGHTLLKSHSSSQLRKLWAKMISDNKIPAHYHLLLSAEKLKEVLTASPLGLILASPEIPHTLFSAWLELGLKHGHLIILNHFQATGFSNHWTSGHNCLVVSAHNWMNELNAQMQNPVFHEKFALTDINKTSLDTMFNELSRLYNKIIYQKTSLIESDSAKV